MKKIISILLTLLIFISCEERSQLQKHLEDDDWVEIKITEPNITILLPEVFTAETYYPEETNVETVHTLFQYSENENLNIVAAIDRQYDDIELWYKREVETVGKQKRKLFRKTERIGEFDFEIMSYTKMNSEDTSTYIGIAFVTIDSLLYDIHNQFENDKYFLKFLKGIKKQ